MPLYTLATFEVRPEARDEAERAMHELATHVRNELPDAVWTTYRDADVPNRYVSMVRATTEAADVRTRQVFVDALTPVMAGKIDFIRCDLVTSSDLGRRPPSLRPGKRRPRPR